MCIHRFGTYIYIYDQKCLSVYCDAIRTKTVSSETISFAQGTGIIN